MDKDSKFSEKETRVIAVQLIAAKGLVKEPLKTIKFIHQNRKYFPSIDDTTLKQLLRENNYTQEDIDNCQEVLTVADYQPKN